MQEKQYKRNSCKSSFRNATANQKSPLDYIKHPHIPEHPPHAAESEKNSKEHPVIQVGGTAEQHFDSTYQSDSSQASLDAEFLKAGKGQYFFLQIRR